MSREHPADLTASELCAALVAGRWSSREVLDAHLERVEARNASVNAVVALDASSARRRADEADAALASGERWGALHGLPMTIKDCFEVVGMPATAGAPELAQHRPERHAVAVQRLVDAGAVLFGKTNVPLYGGDLQTYNEVYGVTGNPWNPDLIPGGSSGGAAAALALGMTPLELGSDIGGSIRNPSHFCGVFGHKPSHGIVSMQGHIPGPPGTRSEGDLVVTGPLARCTADLRLALDVLVAPPPGEEAAWRIELPEAQGRSLSDFRVAAWLDDPNCRVSSEVGDRLQHALDALAAAGARIDDRARPAIDTDRSSECYQLLLQSVMGAGMPPEAHQRIAEAAASLDPNDRGLMASILRGTVLSHRDWLRTDETRLKMKAAWHEFFQSYDILLCPVMPTVAYPHDPRAFTERAFEVDGRPQPFWSQLFWAGLTGVVYLPSTVVPVGAGASGLPVGMQVVANYLQDRTALAFAERVESVVGGFVAPPVAA
ncbi:amidase [Myxococcota bacterium]|nr:amidase [Myxococcota bacterium]